MTLGLAADLAARGRRVMLIDADGHEAQNIIIQAHLTFHLGNGSMIGWDVKQ